MNRIIRAALIVAIFITGICLFQISRLSSENNQLRKNNASIIAENTKLKDTADYHYKEATDMLASNRYEEAQKEYEVIASKYPTSPLLKYATQQISFIKSKLAKIEAQKIAEEKKLEKQLRAEERKRKEEGKYRPKSENEAINEWKEFRRGQNKYLGTITTWRIKIYSISDSSGMLYGYVDNDDNCKVVVSGKNPYLAYTDSVTLGQLPRVVEGDRIVVTGAFRAVTNDGNVGLEPIRVINEGP